MNYLKISVITSLLSLLFSGCVVGKVVAAPFHAAGEIINVVTPDIVGDTVSGVGTVVDTIIPF